MKLVKKIALLMLAAAIHLPCAGHAAEEDRELALIAAEQEDSGDEQLDDINPALTETITTERTQDTDKEIRERKRKLQKTRKEKEEENERRLKESTRRDNERTDEEQTIIIDPNAPPPIEPEPPAPPPPPPVVTPQPQPATPPQVLITPQTTETAALPDQKLIYANFTEVARAVKFIPLYIPRKSGYEITALYGGQGIAEIRYGRRWEPTVSLTVRTHKRTDGEAPSDISGVSGIKWRVDTSTGTTIYIAKISETQQVAAWAVGHYTFSAQAENLSYAGFHSLVADELVELSTHYYLDL